MGLGLRNGFDVRINVVVDANFRISSTKVVAIIGVLITVGHDHELRETTSRVQTYLTSALL